MNVKCALCGVPYETEAELIEHLRAHPTHVTPQQANLMRASAETDVQRSRSGWCDKCERVVQHRSQHTTRHSLGQIYCWICHCWLERGSISKHNTSNKRHLATQISQLRERYEAAAENERRRVLAEIQNAQKLQRAANRQPGGGAAAADDRNERGVDGPIDNPDGNFDDDGGGETGGVGDQDEADQEEYGTPTSSTESSVSDDVERRPTLEQRQHSQRRENRKVNKRRRVNSL